MNGLTPLIGDRQSSIVSNVQKKDHIAALYFILSEEKKVFRTAICILNPPASFDLSEIGLCLIISKLAQSLQLFFLSSHQILVNDIQFFVSVHSPEKLRQNILTQFTKF